MKTFDRDELIQQIVAALESCDGRTLEAQANNILEKPVTYRRDWGYEGGAFDQQE